MNLTYSTVASIVSTPILIFISLLTGLSLTGRNQRSIIKPLIIISAAISLIYISLDIILPGGTLYLLGIIPLLLYLFKKVFQLYFSFSMLALLLALNLFMLHAFLSPFISGHLFVNLAVTLIYAAIGIWIYGRQVTLLPNRAGAFLASEGSPAKKVAYGLLPTLVALSLTLIWTGYCLNSLHSYTSEHQRILFSFTAILFLLLGYFINIYAAYIKEKTDSFMNQKNQEEILNFMQVIRSQRHDFNFHLQAIYGLLENKRYSECADYVKAMVDEVSEMNEVLPLYHPAVSALLSTFREVAAHKGIKLEISIHYNLYHMPCTESEMNKIIGNLVQNAIDEVEQHSPDHRWIQVVILKRSGKSVIKVTNLSNNEIGSYKDMFNPGFSTKPSHEGIGLATVQKIVSKYDGMVYPEFEEDKVHFIVQIPNRVQAGDENWNRH